uniref:Uncharacterized protein n=1 Tax=Solanum lycopersicum TaxID=4081 RepID=A0A3Q7EGX3_SOLLC
MQQKGRIRKWVGRSETDPAQWICQCFGESIEIPLFNFPCMAILYLLDESLYICNGLIFEDSGSVEVG